jgi:Tol biopolymer transport system component
MQLAWFDRTGAKVGVLGTSQGHQAVAADDVRVAADRIDPIRQTRDVWVFDTKAGTQTQLTFGAGDDWVPEWSPDGRRVAYTSARETPGVAQLYLKDATGTGEETLLLKTDRNKHHMAWSPDGRHLIYEENAGFNDLWVLPLSPPGKPHPLLQTQFQEGHPSFSPDSRYLAYVSNESGRLEVYVQTFPSSGGRWRVSLDGGIQPRWRRDGREMYFLAADGQMMALDVDLRTPTFGAPRPLFQTWLGGDALTEHYAVTSDGRRFLLYDQQSAGTEFTVLLNWGSLLTRTSR